MAKIVSHYRYQKDNIKLKLCFTFQPRVPRLLLNQLMRLALKRIMEVLLDVNNVHL